MDRLPPCLLVWPRRMTPPIVPRTTQGSVRMPSLPEFDRRRFRGMAAATGAAGPHGLLALSRGIHRMTGTLTEAARPTGSGSPDIRPFKAKFSDAEVADLRSRVKATKWPDRETVPDYTQGVRLETMQALASYWATRHDWRKAEARINSFPNFITEIDGLDIHFIHVRSKHENALPVIITHGWPGSIIEQLKVIEPLTDPTSHGGTAADAFHVVVPSLPGYGFSGKPTAPGWNPV